MRAPIAFMIFNRPDLTGRVFAEIARARPKTLLVVADGPRAHVEGEADKCRAAREVIERVDWPCEVLTNYADVNMGCARRPSSGLQWVFDQVEEAVVLEDDCLPHPSFFRYCDELLEQYRHDTRVMHISGDRMVPPSDPAFSYSFSRYCASWGWATWRRAFQHYDFRIERWPALRETAWLSDMVRDARAVEHWRRIFDATHEDVLKVNTWDFQWVFACWTQSALSVVPAVNLVSNIGFRPDATHTTRETHEHANSPYAELTFPLAHPREMIRDAAADQLFFDTFVAPERRESLADRLRRRCADVLPTTVRDSIASRRARLASSPLK